MKITLASKFALTALVLSKSKNQEEVDYVSTTTLLPAYHMTPETIEELKINNLIDENNVPTPAGVWFTYNHGVSDAPPSFQKFVKALNLKAQQALLLFTIGELAVRHQTSKSIEVKKTIEGIMDVFERFFTGSNVQTIISKGVIPKAVKSISAIAKDYAKIKDYNKSKYEN